MLMQAGHIWPLNTGDEHLQQSTVPLEATCDTATADKYVTWARLLGRLGRKACMVQASLYTIAMSDSGPVSAHQTHQGNWRISSSGLPLLCGAVEAVPAKLARHHKLTTR